MAQSASTADPTSLGTALISASQLLNAKTDGRQVASVETLLQQQSTKPGPSELNTPQHTSEQQPTQLLSVKRRRDAISCAPDNQRYATFNFMLNHLNLEDVNDVSGEGPLPSPMSLPPAEKNKFLANALCARSVFFASLAKPVQESIISEMYPQRCPAGTVIVTADSVADTLSVVYSGQVVFHTKQSSAPSPTYSRSVALSPVPLSDGSHAAPSLAASASGIGPNESMSNTSGSGPTPYSTTNPRLESTAFMTTSAMSESSDMESSAPKLSLAIAPSSASENDPLATSGELRSGKRVCVDTNLAQQEGRLTSMSTDSGDYLSEAEVVSTPVPVPLASIHAATTSSGVPAAGSNAAVKLAGPGTLISEGCIIHPHTSRVTITAHTDVYLFSIEGGVVRLLISSANKARYNDLRTFLSQMPFLIQALSRRLNSSSKGSSAVNSPSLGPQSGSNSPNLRLGRSPYRLASPSCPPASLSSRNLSLTSLTQAAPMPTATTTPVAAAVSAASRRRRSLSPGRVPTSNDVSELTLGRIPSSSTLSPAAPQRQASNSSVDTISPLLTARPGPPPVTSGEEPQHQLTPTGSVTTSHTFRRYKIGRPLPPNASVSGTESGVSSGTCSAQTSPQLRPTAELSGKDPERLDASRPQSEECVAPVPSKVGPSNMGTHDHKDETEEPMSSGGAPIVKLGISRALSWTPLAPGEVDQSNERKSEPNPALISSNDLSDLAPTLPPARLATSRPHPVAISAQEMTPRSVKTVQYSTIPHSHSPAPKSFLSGSATGDGFVVPALPPPLKLRTAPSTEYHSPSSTQLTRASSSTTNQPNHGAEGSSKASLLSQSPRRRGVSPPLHQIHVNTSMSHSLTQTVSSCESSTPVTPTAFMPPLNQSSFTLSHQNNAVFMAELAKVVEVLVESCQMSRPEINQAIPDHLDCFYIIMKGAIAFPSDSIHPKSPHTSQRFSFKLGESGDPLVATLPSQSPTSSGQQVVLSEGQIFFPRSAGHQRHSSPRSIVHGTVLLIVDADKVYAAMPWLRPEVEERASLDWIAGMANTIPPLPGGLRSGDRSSTPSPLPLPRVNSFRKGVSQSQQPPQQQ